MSNEKQDAAQEQPKDPSPQLPQAPEPVRPEDDMRGQMWLLAQAKRAGLADRFGHC